MWVPLCNQDQEGSEVVLFHAGYFTNVRKNTARLIPTRDTCTDLFAFHPPFRCRLDSSCVFSTLVSCHVGEHTRADEPVFLSIVAIW